jgi:hypothetical protein
MTRGHFHNRDFSTFENCQIAIRVIVIRAAGCQVTDEAVLALPMLTVHQEDEFGGRAWKGHDWDALNRLDEKGFTGDPVSRAESVIVTPQGLADDR